MKNILLAILTTTLAALACFYLATIEPWQPTPLPEPTAPAQPEPDPEPPPAASADPPEPAFTAPLSDLVNTLPPPPEPQRPQVRHSIYLPPSPQANYCPIDPQGIPQCDPDKPMLLFQRF